MPLLKTNYFAVSAAYNRRTVIPYMCFILQMSAQIKYLTCHFIHCHCVANVSDHFLSLSVKPHESHPLLLDLTKFLPCLFSDYHGVQKKPVTMNSVVLALIRRFIYFHYHGNQKLLMSTYIQSQRMAAIILYHRNRINFRKCVLHVDSLFKPT